MREVGRALVSLTVILLLATFATGWLAHSKYFSAAMRKAPRCAKRRDAQSAAMRKAPHEFCSNGYTVAACVTIPFLLASWVASAKSGFRTARHVFWAGVHLGFVYIANATGGMPSIAVGEETANRFFIHHEVLVPIFLAVNLVCVAFRAFEIKLWSNANSIKPTPMDSLTRDPSNPYEAPLEE